MYKNRKNIEFLQSYIQSYNFILMGMQKIHTPLTYFYNYDLSDKCRHELFYKFVEKDTNIIDIIKKNIHLGKLSLENRIINDKNTIDFKINMLDECESYDLLFQTSIVFLIDNLLKLDFKKSEQEEHFLIEISDSDIMFYAGIIEMLFLGKEKFKESN